MPAEPFALSTRPPPEPTAETDYEAICAAVTATARGRWFLDEYTRRNRNSDTTQVLAAIARLEAVVASDRAEQASHAAHQEVRIELLEMARTIAQTRAEVAESRPQPAQQQLAPPPTGVSAAPDVAAAAERLRQIAWTMRACGVELPVSDQIGQIADAILSIDTRQGLGDQRAQRLTEALHYLERRIDRLLDSYRTESTEAAPARVVSLPVAKGHDHGAAAGDTAVADTAELSINDDVVVTVAENVPEAPQPALAAATHEAVSTTETADPEPAAKAAATVDVQETPVERGGLDLQPLTPPDEPQALDAEPQAPDAEDQPESTSAGFDLEPLATSPYAAEAQDQLYVATHEPADERTLVADIGIDDDIAIDDSIAHEPFVQAEEPGDDAVAEPTVTVPSPTANGDAIAVQVGQDLGNLTEIAPADDGECAAPDSSADKHANDGQPMHAATVDDPADFLLEAPIDDVPPPAPPANMNAAHAMVSHALLAIEAELFDGPANAPAASLASAPPPTHAARRTAMTAGPLAALMAMSEEERIALFS
jgi:hypothetical protein